MLKLTHAVSRLTVYISPAQIVGLLPANKGTEVITAATNWHPVVLEAIDQIIAMPEMVKHLHPMFRVDAAPYEPFPGATTEFRSIGEFSRAVERHLTLVSHCGTPHHSIDDWNRCAVCNPAKREL